MRFVFKNNNKPDKPVLFIHGLSAHFLNMLRLQSEIVDHDYYAAMLPGHYMGDNVKIAKRKIILFADQIAEWANNLNIENLTIIGHSLGGAISLILLKLIPQRIKGVILISPLTPNISFLNANVNKIRLKVSIQLVIKFVTVLFDAKLFYKTINQLLAGTFDRQNYLKQYFLSWFCTKEEREHSDLIMPINKEIYKIKSFTNSFQNYFLKNLLLIHDAFRAKSIKAINKGIKTATKMKTPLVYMYGEKNDVLTPYEETVKYFKKYYPKAARIKMRNSAHWGFLADYQRFIQVFYNLTNNQQIKSIN